MGWEKNNCLIDFKWVLIRRKKAREIKDASRDASYKLKSKLVVIPRNTQYVRGSCWETPYKRVLWKLIYLINYLKEIKKQLHWAIHNLYYKRGFLTVVNQRTIGVFTIFLWLRIVIVLQWIWYYSTSWVSNIDYLVLVLTFDSKLLSVRDFAWIKYLFVS